MTKTQPDLPTHPSGYSPYDVAEHLRNPAEMAAYLDAWLQKAPDDVAGIARALGGIARAKWVAQVEVDIDD